MDSKKYNNINLGFGIAKSVLTFFLILAFLMTGLSDDLENYLNSIFESKYIVLIVYIIISGSAVSIIFFPMNLYTDFILEHKYKLSNQTFFAWIWGKCKKDLSVEL